VSVEPDAKLRTVPDPGTPLITDVRNIFFAGTERVYRSGQRQPVQSTADARERIPKDRVYSEGDPASPDPSEVAGDIEAPRVGQTLGLHPAQLPTGGSYMHQVVGRRAVGRHGSLLADFDIDLGDPLQDVDGFVVEWASSRSAATPTIWSCTMRSPKAP